MEKFFTAPVESIAYSSWYLVVVFLAHRVVNCINLSIEKLQRACFYVGGDYMHKVCVELTEWVELLSNVLSVVMMKCVKTWQMCIQVKCIELMNDGRCALQ